MIADRNDSRGRNAGRAKIREKDVKMGQGEGEKDYKREQEVIGE